MIVAMRGWANWVALSAALGLFTGCAGARKGPDVVMPSQAASAGASAAPQAAYQGTQLPGGHVIPAGANVVSIPCKNGCCSH